MAALAAFAAVVTWRHHGSLAAQDWLPLALVVGLVVATVAASGTALRPARGVLAGAGALLALAGWTAVSAAWSPTPSGARDEALLTLLYACALLVPPLTLSGSRRRRDAVVAVVAALAVVGVATALELVLSGDPTRFFFGGRLDFPISYVNACAAFFVLGFWPAVVVASRRGVHPALRIGALAAGGVLLALAVAAQSKGTIVGLVASTVLVFAFAPSRLRLVPAFVLAVAPAAAAAGPLTAPFRSAGATAAHHAGLAVLGAGAACGVLGAAYVAVDRRFPVRAATSRLLGRVLLGTVVAVAAGAIGVFSATHAPGPWLSQKWASFKHPASASTGSTHLASLGSNRYDFWRVALDEARAHPLAGIGGRGFYSAYLQLRRSNETPLRAHSLYLDVLSETGVPGLVLLLVGIGGPLLLLGRGLGQPSAAASFGSAVYFFTHAAVDWVWTVPVVGVVAFLLIGIGCAGDDERRVPRPLAVGGAVAGAAAALLAFAPPWLAYRYVTAAYTSAAPASDLRHARALDPLSLEPYFAAWRLAPTLRGKVAALERARTIEPKSVVVLYQLGLLYAQQGRRADALSTLRRASALDPLDASVRAAVRAVSG